MCSLIKVRKSSGYSYHTKFDVLMHQIIDEESNSFKARWQSGTPIAPCETQVADIFITVIMNTVIASLDSYIVMHLCFISQYYWFNKLPIYILTAYSCETCVYIWAKESVYNHFLQPRLQINPSKCHMTSFCYKIIQNELKVLLPILLGVFPCSSGATLLGLVNKNSSLLIKADSIAIALIIVHEFHISKGGVVWARLKLYNLLFFPIFYYPLSYSTYFFHRILRPLSSIGL